MHWQCQAHLHLWGLWVHPRCNWGPYLPVVLSNAGPVLYVQTINPPTPQADHIQPLCYCATPIIHSWSLFLVEPSLLTALEEHWHMSALWCTICGWPFGGCLWPSHVWWWWTGAFGEEWERWCRWVQWRLVPWIYWGEQLYSWLSANYLSTYHYLPYPSSMI